MDVRSGKAKDFSDFQRVCHDGGYDAYEVYDRAMCALREEIKDKMEALWND